MTNPKLARILSQAARSSQETGIAPIFKTDRTMLQAAADSFAEPTHGLSNAEALEDFARKLDNLATAFSQEVPRYLNDNTQPTLDMAYEVQIAAAALRDSARDCRIAVEHSTENFRRDLGNYGVS